jgi:hypothetical protein
MGKKAAIAQVKRLIKRYEAAKTNLDAKHEAYRRAVVELLNTRLSIEAVIQSNRLSTYGAVYIAQRDAKSGRMSVQRLIAEKNLNLGAFRAIIAEYETAEAPRSPEDDKACDDACEEASQDYTQDPNYPGDGAWTCDCIITDGGVETVINGVVDE